MIYKLEFKIEEIQILAQGLLEVPTKFGMPLLEKLQKEVNAQSPKETSDSTTPKMEVVEDEA